MNLDIRTMMVTISALTFLFSGLLALAGLHAGSTRGIRYWAVASLCISITMALAYFQLTVSSKWIIVLGAILLAMGMCFQLIGLQVFKNVRCNWNLVICVIALVFVQSVYFTVYRFEPGLRAIANSLVYAFINFACARLLLVPAELPLRTAYRFTGLSFAFLGVVMVARASAIALSSPDSYTLYSNLMINPLTFFVSSMAQLCLTFGFVLMINYRMAGDLQTLASRDSLTGAYNRRSLEEEGIRMWARCSRRGESLGLMMIDIDHFKSINDRYGHLAGDEVLRKLTELATNSIRTDDYFARFGGEEFCILLPSISEEEARKLAERIREAYENLNIRFNGAQLKSTISIGVAISNPYDAKFQLLVEKGDQALYRAKLLGRNCVITGSNVPAGVASSLS